MKRWNGRLYLNLYADSKDEADALMARVERLIMNNPNLGDASVAYRSECTYDGEEIESLSS